MLRVPVVALGAVLMSGCTFYTACPNGSTTGSNNNTGSAGAPAAAGSGNSGNNAGSGNSASGGISGVTPTDPWVDATGDLEGRAVGYGAVTYVSSKPDEDVLIAGLSEYGLWGSVDGGDSWTAMGTGKGSDKITNRPSSIQYDPKDASIFWEGGSYGPGVLETSDDGETFTGLGSIGGVDSVSVDFSDPKRKTLAASGHEKSRNLEISSDGGDTWQDVGPSLPDGTNSCSFPVVIDSQTLLVTCSQFGVTESGIFRSTDLGDTWTKVSTTPAWNPALVASDGSIYWPNETGGLLKSADQGQTWTQVLNSGTGLPALELPDGSIAAWNGRTVVVSADGGMSWRVVTSEVSAGVAGLAYSPFQKAFYAWQLSTNPTIPALSIQKFDFDYSASP